MPSVASSGKATEIREAIQSAIQFYESELFWFNEQQAIASTEDGFEYYAVPADFIQMFSLSLQSGSHWETLEPVSLDETEQRLANVASGKPTSYCTFNQQFRLAPAPNASFNLRLSYIKRLPALLADADTNSWMTDAEPMIRAAAKAILFLDVSHDVEQAAVQNGIAELWFKRLQKHSGQYLGMDQIQCQVF